MKVRTSFRTIVMIPGMEVACSDKRLVGSIRTPKSRQFLYIQMIMTIIIYCRDNIKNISSIIVSNKPSYVFLYSPISITNKGWWEYIPTKKTKPPNEKRPPSWISINSLGGAQLMCYLHTETLTATLPETCYYDDTRFGDGDSGDGTWWRL